MQTAPTGWPTDDAELAPTATATHDIDGSDESVAPVAWSVRRELATDLPDQIQAAEGLSVASAHVELAQDDAEATANVWSPWQGRTVVRQPAGASIQLSAGFAGVEIPMFKGRVAEPSGDITSPGIELECDDLAALLRRPATLPAVAREMPYDNGGVASTLYTGLSATWAIDALLRQGDFCATPALVDGAVLAWTFQGSVWPERGTLTTASQGDTTQPVFDDITWSDRRALAWQAPSSGTFVLRAQTSGPLDIAEAHICGWTDGSSGTITIELRAGDDDDSRITITISTDLVVRLRSTTAGIDTSDTFTFSGGPWDVRTERLSATSIRVTVDTDDGQDTSDLTTGGLGGSLTNAVVSAASGDRALAGLQVAPRQSGTVAVGHTPTADLDPSLNVVDGTPGLESDVTQWTVLREIAAAELGAVAIDESGVAVFRNRNSLRGVGGTPLQVTARDSILGLQWWSSVQQVRSEVRVPVMPVAVDVSTTYEQTVWQLGDKIKLYERGRRPLTIFALLDTVPIGLDLTFTQSEDADEGSVYAAHPNADGSGSLRTLILTAEQLQPRLVKIVARSNYGHTNPDWIVDSNGDPRLILRALATIAQPDTAEGFAVATNDDVEATYGTSVLEMPASRWMQDIDSAQQVAWWLAEQTSQPQPIIRNVPVVPGPDTLRLQLGDVIELVDPVVMAATVRCVVTGIYPSGSAGRMDLSLRLRPLPYLFADFDSEWDGETFSDFNTEIGSSVTFADYNKSPWRSE